MITTRLRVPLEYAEYIALQQIAIDELRNPTDQARFILRLEFERRGLLGVPDLSFPNLHVENNKRAE